MPKPTPDSHTPISDAMIAQEWPKFIQMVHARLENGKKIYGDASFLSDGPATCEEIAQEIADIMGWTFILHCRVQHLAAKLGDLEQSILTATC